MATHFQYDCPHCATKQAGFVVQYQWASRNGGAISNLLAICGVCNRGLLIESFDRHSTGHPDLVCYQLTFPEDRFHIMGVWPDGSHAIPSGAPSNVTAFFTQGIENHAGRRWDAAGAMFRKTLDVSTKLIHPESKSLTLFKRIEKLVEVGLLTPAMGDWSHEIRLDGNDAVHDEDPETAEDSLASLKFTEAFLNYAFSLPEMVSRNRKKRSTE